MYINYQKMYVFNQDLKTISQTQIRITYNLTKTVTSWITVKYSVTFSLICHYWIVFLDILCLTPSFIFFSFQLVFSGMSLYFLSQINSVKVWGLVWLCMANSSDDNSLQPTGTGRTVLTHTTPLYSSTSQGHSNPTIYHYTAYRLNTRPGERMTEWWVCVFVHESVCVWGHSVR